MGKKILVVGSGGREHAIVRALSEGSSVSEILCTPGNSGTAGVSGCRNVDLSGNQVIVSFARDECIDLVIVGPEIPLAEGLIDDLEAAGIAGFGPAAVSARLEASKGFAKDFMDRNSVATAAYTRYTDADKARSGVEEFGFPVVIKADGLAAGKGVLICGDRSEALAAIDSVMVSRDFGNAGNEVVIEECLTGWETSIIGIVDAGGETFMSFLPARDHKRAGEGDTGLNTGGMGVIAPHPLVDSTVAQDIQKNIIDPTMRGLKAEKLAYAGFLFIGVMVTDAGAKTLEYNVRFGDPEAQALLPLLDGDLNEYMEAALAGKLSETKPRWRGGASCCVVMASEGYPGAYSSGKLIHGIVKAEESGCRVYSAGVAFDNENRAISSGGRVLGVTAVAERLEDARILAYKGVEEISFDGAWVRTDIGTSGITF